MNSCCPTEIVDGGRFINPILIAGELKAGFITGGVTIDDATALTLASQLCPVLDSCVMAILRRNELSDLNFLRATVRGLTIRDSLVIDENVQDNLITQLTAKLQPVIKHSVETQVLHNVKLENVILSGIATMDATVIHSVLVQLTNGLQSIIKQSVESQLLTGVELENVKLSGTIEIDDVTATMIASALDGKLDSMITAVVGKVEHMVLNAVQSTIRHLTVTDLLTLEEPALLGLSVDIWGKIAGDVQTVAVAAAKALKPTDIGAVSATDGVATNLSVTNGNFENVSMNGGTVNNTTGSNNHFTGTQLTNTELTGTITADLEAIGHLCSMLQECFAEFVPSPSDIAAVFRDCDGVTLQALERLATCQNLNDALEEFAQNLPALDIIDGIDFDETTRTLSIRVKLDDGTEKTFTVSLDSLGGQVSADDITILGDGTSTNRLRVNLVLATNPTTTTGAELPTDVLGDRTALMGKPVGFVQLGNYKLPYY